MLVVSGETAGLCAMRATCCQRTASTSPASAAGRGGHSPCAAASQEQAMRHGSRTAAAAPGSRTVRSAA